MDQTLVGMAKTVVVVDATVPTAQLLGTDQEPHSYDVATGVLALKGVSLGTIIAAGDATKNVIDIVETNPTTRRPWPKATAFCY